MPSGYTHIDMCNIVSEGVSDLPAYGNDGEAKTPCNYNEAMQLDPESWGAAMAEEISTLVGMKCWDLVRASEMTALDNLTGSTWVFRIKNAAALRRPRLFTSVRQRLLRNL